MTEVDIETILPALESRANQLSEASDHANRVLTAIEKRLVKLNIGLEVWHSTPLDSTDLEENPSLDEISSRVIQVLGLARVEGKWCLAVKPVRLGAGYYEGDMDCPFENRYADGPPVPLLKQSRSLRIAALRTMREFLVELDKHIASTIDDLQEATKLMQ